MTNTESDRKTRCEIFWDYLRRAIIIIIVASIGLSIKFRRWEKPEKIKNTNKRLAYTNYYVYFVIRDQNFVL